MEDSAKRQNTNSLRKKLENIIKLSNEIQVEHHTQYRLKPKTSTCDESKPYRKIFFGERDKNKPHKTILIVGETGTGKSTLINVMVNYKLGVQREDKVWFVITDEHCDRSSVQSQTSILTVYGVYLEESETDLTILDTPGYGDTRGIKFDKDIAESLLCLCTSEEGVQEIDAVCLVINATQNRLSEKQIYIFDAVQCLFGRDISQNIVLLFTHSNGQTPKNALKSVKEAKVKCAVDEQKKQPVFFLFDNCQSDTADEEDNEMILDQTWNRSFKGMEKFFMFLETVKPKSVQMTRDVLQKRKQLEANISNLQSRVQIMELKQNELKQTQQALEQNEQYVKQNKNFEYEVDVAYKERVDIDLNLAYKATCCTVCEENCHYPGCWWFTLLSLCSVMKDNHCTVCTKKCHYSKHVKEAKIYVTKTKKEKRMYEDLKKKYDGKIETGMSWIKKLDEELQELKKEKGNLLSEAFHCVETLRFIALNTDSLFILQHVDFLIEKLKEINEPEKVKTLEDIKKSAGEEKKSALGFFTSYFKK